MEKKDNYSYPKNSINFKKLVIFSKYVINLMKKVQCNPIIYGSFTHFYYTKDESLEVHDIDLMVPKENYEVMIKALEEDGGIEFEYNKENGEVFIRKGDLLVEVDYIGHEKLRELLLSGNEVKKIDFYGTTEVNIISLKVLEGIYVLANRRENTDAEKILRKSKLLEEFLGRKLNPLL